MKEIITFDDVLITPSFSEIRSRRECRTDQMFLDETLSFPLISSNMDSVTSPEMAFALSKFGSVACLHRFQSIEENIKQWETSADTIFNTFNGHAPLVSVGIGEKELQRAIALNKAGARRFVIDVAHGAASHVVHMYDLLREKLNSDSYIVVGNFATAESIKSFNYYVKTNQKPDAFKVGIGGGSMCTTRIVSGIGHPTLGSVMDCVTTEYPIIADGGIRSSGDIAKALAAGATAVMVGGLLAGTDEAPGEIVRKTALSDNSEFEFDKKDFSDEQLFDEACAIVSYATNRSVTCLQINKYKKYQGSASLESYQKQNKTASHRAPEGESTLVPYKGPVTPILQALQAGVQSAMSYVGASNLDEFREQARFIKITNNGYKESLAHGKK